MVAPRRPTASGRLGEGKNGASRRSPAHLDRVGRIVAPPRRRCGERESGTGDPAEATLAGSGRPGKRIRSLLGSSPFTLTCISPMPIDRRAPSYLPAREPGATHLTALPVMITSPGIERIGLRRQIGDQLGGRPQTSRLVLEAFLAQFVTDADSCRSRLPGSADSRRPSPPTARAR